jgi:hypothetical protein
MTKVSNPRSWAAGILLTALALGALAPAADAKGHGNGNRRYRGYEPRVVRAGYPVRRVVIQRHSDNLGPALLGFIGGLVVGSAIHSHPVYASAPPPECDYYDSYCDERFSSMSDYDYHLRRHHHPRVVLVVNVRSGECVGGRRWHDGRWYEEDMSRYRGSRYGNDDCRISRYEERDRGYNRGYDERGRGYSQGQYDEGDRYDREDGDSQYDDRRDDR